MVTAPDFIGRISSVVAHLLPRLTRVHLSAALPLSGGQCYTDPDRGLGRAWGPQHARVAPPDHGGSPCPPGPHLTLLIPFMEPSRKLVPALPLSLCVTRGKGSPL